MNESHRITSSSVPFGDKVAFGIGMLANQMFPAALGIFMVVLVQDLGFPGWMWGIIYFFPRIFDCFTDPIMGFISDNTKSRWGRRRQYVFIGALIMGITFIVMWQLYRENGINYNFTYFMLWSFGFYLGITIFSVPYVAMGYEMSEDFHERTNIMAVAQWIGQWVWVIAPWFWVIMYDQSWFESADTATRDLAVWVGIACMLFAITPAIFLKSRPTINENYMPLTLKNIGSSLKEIFDGFKEAFGLRPFRKLCIATFLIYNTFYTIASFSFFIIVYYLFNGAAGAAGIWPTLFGSVGALATTFIVIPIVTKMSGVMGKKKAFITSQGISVVGYILLWFLFIPSKPYMFLMALPFFSFGIGSLFTLMMSMTADVIDIDELNTGKRREGIFGAIYWWMVKFGFAIAGGLSGTIMSLVGFTSGTAEQSEGAVLGLRIFYSGFPILGTLAAIGVMWKYDITEKSANKVQLEIKRRKGLPPVTSAHNEKYISQPDLDMKIESGIDFSSKSEVEIQELFKNTLNKGMHGISFSPYLESQNVGDRLSKEQISRRMDVIKPYTKWVRLFSCVEGNEFTPQVPRNKGLKSLAGAWISRDLVQNEKEINSLIELAKARYVDIAAIGNEVLLRGDLDVSRLIDYIKRLKIAVPDLKTGCVDAYYKFYEYPELVKVCDIILANFYPFWEGAHVEKASNYLQKMFEITKEAAKGRQVIIAETGWPSRGDNMDAAEPSKINAMKYFINTNIWSWQQGVDLFYFSSFDESWKIRQEGDVGQSWGIWDKNEKLKLLG
ncbi:MAG: MFS transporter [Ekhidna sp.]|nr:MFS transporter [Ekhidna sp.]MBC6427417.1 MFS transporter [Ekhidna sp.]